MLAALSEAVGKKAPASSVSYRFQVGNKVLCRVGRDEWAPGRIVMLNYREPDWPPSKQVPYQVLLEDGRLIFVPRDIEELCRLIVPPWWGAVLDKPGSHFARNPPADELRKAGAGQDVNVADHRGHVALMEAVRFRWRSGIEELVAMKADVNIANSKKETPLHAAAVWGADLMQILLKAKADPNRQDTDPDYDPEFSSTTFGDRLEHRAPLHYCCVEGDAAAVSALIEAKAKVDLQDAQYKTPLHLAIEEGKHNVIDILLQAGADVNLGNISSGKQDTPLMDAARTGNHALAERLILARADVNRTGRQRMGAAHFAARRGDAQMLQLLLKARADTTHASANGTVEELAKKNGKAELLEVLDMTCDAAIEGSKVTSVAALSPAQRAALCLD